MEKWVKTSRAVIGTVLVIGGLFYKGPAFAVKVTSLYQAELPVPAQTDDLKAQAIHDGLLQVLIKLSGDTEIGKNPNIEPSLERADYYVKELSYLPSTTASSEYLLRIRYDAEDINRLLRKAGVAHWGETRPLILVWLAVTNQQHATEIVASEMPGSLFQQMKQQSNLYGLPVIFPMMDVADMSQISPSDVTTMAIPMLKEAAKRYAPDALLIGIVEQGDTDYKSRWQLILGHKKWQWEITDTTPNNVIASIVHQVSTVLAKQDVIKTADKEEQWVKLEVSHITQPEDLAKLIKYVKQLKLVQQVQLSHISGDVVDITVLVNGSIGAFKESIATGHHLDFKYQEQAENRLGYVWTR